MKVLSDLIGTLQRAFSIGPATLDAQALTGPRTLALPDASGTVALDLQRIAISDGDTAPDPGGTGAAGTRAWSTSAQTSFEWDGSAWRVAAPPASLNTIRDGQIVTIPATHNLLVVGTLDIQGTGVLDAQGLVIEVS